MNSILLISDTNEIKPFLPVEKTTTLTYDEFIHYTYPIQTDIVLFYGIQIDLEKYSYIVDCLKDYNGAVFGIDIGFSNDVIEASVFEHIYQCNNEKYNRSLEVVIHSNTSMIPKIMCVKAQTYNIGIAGNADIIGILPKYVNISYSQINDENVHLYGYDGIIISGKINISFMMAILTSCKPFITYSKNEPRTLHNFLLKNISWGENVNIHTSKLWWDKLYVNLLKVSASVHYPLMCVKALSDDDIVQKLTDVLGLNVVDWYYGRSILHNGQINALFIGKLISFWKSKRIDSPEVELIQSAIDNNCIIDISSIHFDNIDMQVVHPIIDERPRVFINLDPNITDTYKSHRSGWKHVVKGLSTLERPFRHGLLFDSCVDRTFLWANDVLSRESLIPYTESWLGIIHHTFSNQCGHNNCSTLFNTPKFIESLHFCKGLIVMSEYLSEQVKYALPPLYSNIPITVVKHPTEFVPIDKCFHPSLFYGTVTHIGNFMRNKQAFIELDVNGWKKQLLNNANAKIGLSCGNGCLAVGGGGNVINECEYSIGPLDDKEYDELLTRTVVFVNLYDASACNTILECIVRKTPIIVNRHPAVIEYLGAEYPGLYSSLNEVSGMCNVYNVKKMYDYLNNNSEIKKDISIKKFLKGIENILFNICT